MALTNWNDILNKPKGIDQVEEIALEVSALSSSVLTIAGDVQELELSVSDLSASVLTIGEEVQEITEEKVLTFADYVTAEENVTLNYGRIKKIGHNLVLVEFGVTYSTLTPGQTKILSIEHFKDNSLFAVRLGGVGTQNYGAAVGLLDVPSKGIYIDTNVTATVAIASFIARADIVEPSQTTKKKTTKKK